MSEMVEKVANAIYQTRVVGGSDDESARAAIEAMREPTREMLVSGIAAIDDAVDTTTDTNETWVYTTGADYALPGWQAMIDAALKG